MNPSPLSREQIEQLPAGRELDALVAENLFDWVYGNQGKYILFMPRAELNAAIKRGAGSPAAGQWKRGHGKATVTAGSDIDHGCPAYSTDLAAAWQVAPFFSPFSLYYDDEQGHSIRYRFEQRSEHGPDLLLLICKVALLNAFDL